MSSDELPPRTEGQRLAAALMVGRAEPIRLRAVAIGDQLEAMADHMKELPPGPARHSAYERFNWLQRELWRLQDEYLRLMGYTPEQIRVLARRDERGPV